MNCKIGDKVRFLNSVGGGVVVRFVSKSIVAVQDEDGFEIPVSVSEVVVINEKNDSIFKSESYAFRSSGSVPEAKKAEEEEEDDYPDFYIPNRKEEEAIDPSSNSYKVLLGFVPFNRQHADRADLDLYVVNDSDYRIAFTIGKWNDKDLLIPIGSGVMEPDSKERICTLGREDFLKLQVFNVSILYFKNRDYQPVVPDQVNLELNPLKFVKANSFKANDYFEEDAVVFTVSTSEKPSAPAVSISPKELAAAMKEKRDERPVLNLKSTAEQEEIDLHIEAITDNWEGLSNGEILELQMARFTTVLEGALRSKTKRVVFIHGVGNGKLKHELRKTLERKYPKLRFQDASFKDYGYGATLVIVK